MTISIKLIMKDKTKIFLEDLKVLLEVVLLRNRNISLVLRVYPNNLDRKLICTDLL